MRERGRADAGDERAGVTGIPGTASRRPKAVTKAPLVGQEWEVSAAEAGCRLDVFLRDPRRLASRGAVQRALERGKVLLNEQDAVPDSVSVELRPGDRVRFWPDRPGSASARWHGSRPVGSAQEGQRGARQLSSLSRNLSIVYEDAALIAINKPAGLLTVPLARRAEALSVAELLEVHQRSRGRGRHPLVVHRIDRDTSGLVVFARSAAAQQALKAQFEAREPERVYLAVVEGIPAAAQGEWVDWLAWDGESLIQTRAGRGDPRARECRSSYRIIEAWPAVPAAALEVRLVTGKRNQIRIQAQLRGHPLIGERMYRDGTGLRGGPSVPSLPRQALHAWRLVVRHPLTGRRLELEAPIPADLLKLMNQLRHGGASGPDSKGRSPKKIVSVGTRTQSSSSYRNSKE